MPPTTPTFFDAQTIINGAFDLCTVKDANENVSPADMNDALRRLNQMISALGIQALASPFVAKETFPTVAFKQDYTVGPGGDFDTTRPESLVGAGLLLPATSGTPRIEIPRGLMTDAAWQGTQVKGLTSGLWTDVYYNPTYAQEWGTLTLWPTPNVPGNDVVIYRLSPVAGFADLTSQYVFPRGWADLFEYGLAERLLTPYKVSDPNTRADVQRMARKALDLVKFENVKPQDLSIDAAWSRDGRGGYNILTGTGG